MKIIVITGQTATGKTDLALKLAKRENGELINYDSRQIYKYLDIITGKDISKDKIALYDIVDPHDYFSSFDYQEYALVAIKQVNKLGKTPILVGGTYFYLSHLLYGVATENIKPNWTLRKQLSDKSVAELQHLLKLKDMQTFNRLNNSDKNNPRRLIRRLEIGNNNVSPDRLTGAANNLEAKLKQKVYVQIIGLRFKDVNKLRQKIRQRVYARLNHGAIGEVKMLIEKGYKYSDPGLRTIGYQQIIKFLQGKLTKEDAVDEWITKEIQYAKRQYTFMKKDVNIKWLEV